MFLGNRMIEVLLIGIGTGHPDHLTLEAVKALKTADIVLIPLKGTEKSELADVRRRLVTKIVDDPDGRLVEFEMPQRDVANPNYLAGVEDWHRRVAATWQREINTHVGSDGRVALLVWGDPSLYDSTLRITARLSESLPLEVRVIPGITSIQALTAAHSIPLNEIGASVLITTGRRLRDQGWPPGVDTLVVMLDGCLSFKDLETDGVKIWWGAYLGLPEEITISGPLGETGPKIIAARSEARARHGWIMDIYILRRTAPMHEGV